MQWETGLSVPGLLSSSLQVGGWGRGGVTAPGPSGSVHKRGFAGPKAQEAFASPGRLVWPAGPAPGELLDAPAWLAHTQVAARPSLQADRSPGPKQVDQQVLTESART